MKNAVKMAAGALFASVLPLAAQTTTPTPPSTCTTPPTGVSTLSIESAIPLSGLQSTITPNIPANILAGIASGAQEIRNRVIYNPQANTVTTTTFLVAAGSPIPTPLETNVGPSTLQSSTLSVTQLFTSCTPVPSVLFVGTISNASPGPFGSVNGSVAAISMGYTTDNPPKINNVVEVVAGLVVAYSASGAGTITFPAAPVTPPGSGGGGPTIILNPAPPTSGSFQVYTNPFYIDASQTTSSAPPITFAWSSDKPVNFTPNNTVANPSITFGSGKGDYHVTLTATDAKGNVSSTTFIVSYVGRF
jgi:hypothetical protein